MTHHTNTPARRSSTDFRAGAARRLGVYLLLPALMATGAYAADAAQVSESTITLQPTLEDGAIAEVVFDNAVMDKPVEAHITLRDVVVVDVDVFVGYTDPDTIIVTPPDGYIAIPETLTIRDGSTGRVLIYPSDAVGM